MQRRVKEGKSVLWNSAATMAPAHQHLLASASSEGIPYCLCFDPSTPRPSSLNKLDFDYFLTCIFCMYFFFHILVSPRVSSSGVRREALASRRGFRKFLGKNALWLLDGLPSIVLKKVKYRYIGFLAGLAGQSPKTLVKCTSYDQFGGDHFA